jgi:hypothetical protein
MNPLKYLGICLLILVSCSSSDFTADSSGIVSGKIYVVGNEPFAKLGLQISSTKMLILNCDKETETLLWKHQGEDAKITFKGTEKTPDGTALKVTKAVLVNKN